MQVKTISTYEAVTTYKDAPRSRMDVGNITQALKEAVSRAIVSEPGVTFVIEPVRPLRKTVIEEVTIEVENNNELTNTELLDLVYKATDHTKCQLSIKSYTTTGVPGTEHILNSPNNHKLAYRIGLNVFPTFEEANAAMMNIFGEDILVHNSQSMTKTSHKHFIDPIIIDDNGKAYPNGITYTCEYDRYNLNIVYERDVETEDVVIIYSN